MFVYWANLVRLGRTWGVGPGPRRRACRRARRHGCAGLYILFSAAVLALSLVAATPATAGSDHDDARAAVQAGRIKPLGEILNTVRQYVPGRVINANIANAGSRQPIYVIRLLDGSGNVREVFVDAQTAKILRVHGK